MTTELADMYAGAMKKLAQKARNVVRDLNPKDELKYFRVRAKPHEVMVAYDNEFLVIIVQRWPTGQP